MAREFECERDGLIIRGADDELVATVERHTAEAHPDLAGKVSGQDILAAAKEAEHGQRSRFRSARSHRCLESILT